MNFTIPANLDLYTFLVATWSAMGISFIPYFIYKRFNRGLGDGQIKNTLLLLAPLIALIIQFIGSNFALSLGLVGSLSIIRFRTAVKSANDLLFLLWSIAIGLGCGSNNLIQTVAGTISISMFLLLLSKVLREEDNIAQSSQLSLTVNQDFDHLTLDSSLLKLMSCSMTKESKELVFVVIDPSKMNLDKIEQMRGSLGVQRVTYINV